MSRTYGFLALAALSFAVYIPSLSGDFVLDDDLYVSSNPVVQTPSRWPSFLYNRDSLRPHATLAAQGYRPLAGLSFGLNWLFGGRNPFWYHLVNSLLHALNVCLVFQLGLTLLGSAAPAAAAALLFCLHPAQVESVAYIGARPNLLALALCLASCLFHLSKRPAASFAAFGLALLSQEVSAFLPVALAAMDLAQGRRPLLRRLWPYAAILAVYLLARHAVLGQTAQRGLWGGGGVLRHLGFAAWGLGRDLRSAFWPADLRICYGLSPAARLGGSPALVWAALGCASLAAARLVRAGRVEGVALAWFLAALLPVSNLVPIDALAADRFLYFPLVGLSLLWAMALARLRPLAAWSAAAALSVAFAYLTVAQELPWQSVFELELHAHGVAPQDPCSGTILERHYRYWRIHKLTTTPTHTIQGPEIY